MGDWYIGQSGRWVYDPDAPGPSVEDTRMQPVVRPGQVPRVGDIGDWIDPNADDPTGDEITDPDHPDFVHPWFGR